MGYKSCGSIVVMLLGGSPGGMLGHLSGVIKPGGAVLAVPIEVVQAWGQGESHLLTGCEEQGTNGIHLRLGSPCLVASYRHAKNGRELRCTH